MKYKLQNFNSFFFRVSKAHALCAHPLRTDYKEFFELSYAFPSRKDIPVKFRPQDLYVTFHGSRKPSTYSRYFCSKISSILHRMSRDIEGQEVIVRVSELSTFGREAEPSWAINASLNDFKVLQAVHSYPERAISIPALFLVLPPLTTDLTSKSRERWFNGLIEMLHQTMESFNDKYVLKIA